jgi:WD40 repeat protein
MSEELYHFRNLHKKSINSIKLDSSEKFLFSCSTDRSIKVLNFAEIKFQQTTPCHIYKNPHGATIKG